MEGDEYKCNICEEVVICEEKSTARVDHLQNSHTEIYDLHKCNPDAAVGFRIEFLHLDELRDGDPKSQPIMLGQVCEAIDEDCTKVVKHEDIEQVPMLLKAKKKKKREDNDTRKRSWVWRYFDRLSNIVFRCNLCYVYLSIKGSNTNNMNRHIRSKHPGIYDLEVKNRSSKNTSVRDTNELEASLIDCQENPDKQAKVESKNRRTSWVWTYFVRVSSILAQCKLCKRNISHGGNATGNMNRHLKMLHSITSEPLDEENQWVWKVFEIMDDDSYYTCKICQYKCIKLSEYDQNINIILQHLKIEHGVISGDQIITSTEDCDALE